MLDARNTTEYTGHFGVFDLMAEFDFTTEQAGAGRDYPIDCTFHEFSGS